jgi:group I intron endonuclease
MKCVYQLRNVVTGYVYIGSTVNYYRRITQHLELLVAGTHFNYKLQRAFVTDGADNFRCEVLRRFDVTTGRGTLYDVEQQYLDTIQNKYNIRVLAREKRQVTSIGIIVHEKHRTLVKRDIRHLTDKPGFFISTVKEAETLHQQQAIIIRIKDKFRDKKYHVLAKYPADDVIEYGGDYNLIYKLENILAKYSII